MNVEGSLNSGARPFDCGTGHVLSPPLDLLHLAWAGPCQLPGWILSRLRVTGSGFPGSRGEGGLRALGSLL